MNKYVKISSLFLLLNMIVAGCLGVPTESFDEQVETLVASTLAVRTPELPEVTFTTIPTLTSEPPTLESFGEVYVFTSAQNVNLRTNPGTLFKVSRVMPENTRLLLLGQAPGGEWLRVMNDEGIVGWVNVNVVMVAYDGPPPPVVEPTDVYLVTGTVMTELNIPVSGVGFAVIQNEHRTDASTDDSGQFYAYLPRTLSGTWRVTYVSISCTSNTMDENCNCKNNICGTADPLDAYVELPQNNELVFVWK